MERSFSYNGETHSLLPAHRRHGLNNIIERIRRRFERGFDPHMVGGKAIDTGTEAERAIAICARLNAVRSQRPKQAIVLWTSDYSAVTMRGKWVYVAKGFAQRLSDDALAFVLAHEMAHHDLNHMRVDMIMTGMMGYRQQMELQADRHGLKIAMDAGFDPAGGLEALNPVIFVDEPEDPLEEWPEAMRDMVRRDKTTHPPIQVRLAAIREAIAKAA